MEIKKQHRYFALYKSRLFCAFVRKKQNRSKLLLAIESYNKLNFPESLKYLNKISIDCDKKIDIKKTEYLIKVYSYSDNQTLALEKVFLLLNKHPRLLLDLHSCVFSPFSVDYLMRIHGIYANQKNPLLASYIRLSLVKELLNRGNIKTAEKLFEQINDQSLDQYYYVEALIHFSKDEINECKGLIFKAIFKLDSLSKLFWLYVHINIVQGNKNMVNVLFLLFKVHPNSKRYEAFYRRVAMLDKRHTDIFSSTRYSQAILSLKKNLGHKYCDNPKKLKLINKKVLVLPIWGLGDEIMLLGLYDDMNAFAKSMNIELHFATDARLYPLLNRSFNNISFTIINRKHRGPYVNKLEANELACLLPDANLYFSFDFHSWANRGVFDHYIPLPLLACEFLQQFKPTAKNKILNVEPISINIQKQCLSKKLGISKKIKAGILWRSNILGEGRSIHYTNLSDWAPIFLHKDKVDFICLQSGDVSSELNQVKDMFEVKIHSVDWFDLHHDIDSLAALLEVLDVVLTPSSFMAELAGAMGAKVIYMLNSAEGLWRIKKDKKDIWYESITTVVSEPYGNKNALIQKTADELNALVTRPKKKMVSLNS